MCLAFIALKSCLTFWPNSVTQIIEFGSQNLQQCHFALCIVKHMALIFDQTNFDKRTEHQMSVYLRDSLPQVLEYLNQIIASTDMTEDTMYQAFSAANHWCDHASKTLIPNEAFITSVIKIMNGELKPEMSLKVIKIVKKLLNKSKYTDTLNNVSNYHEAHKTIPPQD